MNAPIRNHYDLENARQLVACAAAAYLESAECRVQSAENCVEITKTSTDTRAVISTLCTQNSSLHTDLVVAFRGTRSLRNFVTDLRCRRVPLFPGAKAEVHEGFKLALDSISPAVEDGLNRRFAINPALRLWLTGHSLGAALAKLFAIRCQWAIAGVYTFGEPRVGNAAFRDYYDAWLRDRTFRVVNGEDFITRIPWLLDAYRHSGTEVFYSAFGGCAAAQPYQIDPPWWLKGFSDVFGTWQEYHAGHRLALLADHHVSRYVEMLNAECRVQSENSALPTLHSALERSALPTPHLR
jgi:triacylglycerol lipase